LLNDTIRAARQTVSCISKQTAAAQRITPHYSTDLDPWPPAIHRRGRLTTLAVVPSADSVLAHPAPALPTPARRSECGAALRSALPIEARAR